MIRLGVLLLQAPPVLIDTTRVEGGRLKGPDEAPGDFLKAARDSCR